MDKNELDNRFWFEYIMKLNDRTLSRRQSSGFTTWAVTALLIIVLYRVLDGSSSIMRSPESWPLFSISFVTIANFIFSLVILASVLLFYVVPQSEVRLMPKLSKAFMCVVYISVIILIGVFGILNFVVVYYMPFDFIARWPYIVFGLFYAMQISYYIIKNLRLRLKAKGEYSDLPSPDIPYYMTESIHRPIYLISFSFLGFILVGFSSLPMIKLFLKTDIMLRVELIKLSLEILAIMFLIVYLLIRISARSQREFLERLERKIVLEKLTSDEIRSIFINEYLGETTRDWITRINLKIRSLYSNFSDAVTDAKENMKCLENIDNKYAYEISGRKKEICDHVQNSFEEYTTYVKKVMQHVRHLIEQRAFTNKDDVELLEHIVEDWGEQLEDIRSQYESLCKTCKSYPK